MTGNGLGSGSQDRPRKSQGVPVDPSRAGCAPCVDLPRMSPLMLTNNAAATVDS